MAALGIGLIFISYSASLYGYCLFRGYNVTPKDLFSQSWPPGARFDAKGAGEATGKAITGAAGDVVAAGKAANGNSNLSAGSGLKAR
jgi:hypothetical protein